MQVMPVNHNFKRHGLFKSSGIITQIIAGFFSTNTGFSVPMLKSEDFSKLNHLKWWN